MSGMLTAARPRRRVMNLAHLLTQQARRQGDRSALIWGDRHWSWKDLDARVEALAVGLSSMGVAPGDRVLVQARNGNQIIETMFACFRLGAVWVPINFRLAPREVAQLAKTCRPVVMICHEEFAIHAAQAQAVASSIRWVVSIDGSAGSVYYEQLIADSGGLAVTPPAVYEDDVCWLFCTSGTTGVPKAAMLTHSQLAFVVTNHIADLMPGLNDQDVSLILTPLSHGAGVHLLAQVARGVKSVLLFQTGLDPDEVWHLVEKWRVTNFFAVPTVVNALIDTTSVDQYDRSTLRELVYAGAPMYRQDQKRALGKLGKVLVQYFGLGEVTGNITVLPAKWHSAEDAARFPLGSCGFERTGMQIKIFDEAGVAVDEGAEGEICVCGPAVFAGYFENDTANAAAFRDGWFRTGDVGRIDARGFLYITGRLSDMYISGGSNVYPREIEEQLLEHPAVSEVGVVGIRDRKWGEHGVAVVVRCSGSSCGEQDLIHFLRERIARYKVPKRFIFVESLPKSGYGKILKSDLRNQIVALTESMGEGG